MNENKRFTIDDESDIIEFDWNTNEYVDDFMWGDGKSWDRVCNRLNELYEENEQLKAVVKEVIELLSEEVDVFSDKATEHDINAYVELQELDNKDAYYMATATKKAIKLLKELLE